MKKAFFPLSLTASILWSLMSPTLSLAWTPGQDFKGSCTFQGQFASGCIEFYDGSWNSDSMFQYCQEKSREGLSVAVVSEGCPRNDFNSLCTTNIEANIANMYVNNMPAYICKKYNAGQLIKRPGDNW